MGHIVPDYWHPFILLVIRGVNQVAAQGNDLIAYAGELESYDLSVVGFDSATETSLINPPLTTLDHG